jgi:hypothetical protein
MMPDEKQDVRMVCEFIRSTHSVDNMHQATVMAAKSANGERPLCAVSMYAPSWPRGARRWMTVHDALRSVVCGHTGRSTRPQFAAEEFRDLRVNAEMDGRAIDAWRVLTRLRRGRG